MAENLNFYEIFDKSKLQYIIDNYENIKDNIRTESTSRLTNINIDPLTLVKKYLYKSKPINNNTNINTINVYYKQNKKVGRHFAVGSLSLQNIPREIRHTISNDLYYDIDIKNAHPEILYQYALKKNLKNKYIKYYIDNRQDIFNEYTNIYKSSPDEIKQQFLCILNGAKTFLKLKDNEMPKLVYKFKQEILNIQQYIFNNELNYKKLGVANAKNKQILNNYDSSNELGSTMNIMLCDIENNILMTMINYLNNMNLIKNKVTLVFDGFMIPKENLKDINIDKLLNELEEHIKTELDYNIKLVVKPMTQGFDTSIKFNNEINNNINDKIIKDDNEGANKVLLQLKNKLYKCNKTIYYKYNNLWIDDLKEILLLLKKIIIENEFIKHIKATKDDLKDGLPVFEYNGIEYCTYKFETYSADNKGATNILEVLKTKIEINNNLINNIIKSSYKKVFFQNGYFDFNIGKFIYNFDDVETMTIIPRIYKESTLELEQKIKKTFFENLFNEDTEEFLLMIARAVSGCVEDKVWSFAYGSRDAGKSMVQKGLGLAFKGYIADINANSLINDNSSGDVAKKLSWAYDFDKYRIAFSNEMKISLGTIGDGVMIKQICSGGDKLLVRKNNIDEKSVATQTTLVLWANDLPLFEPVDVYEKLIPFSIKTRYVNEEITPKLLQSNPYYKQADPNIFKLFEDDNVLNAIVSIIFKSYKPYKVTPNDEMKIILETFTDGNNIMDIITENFEITGNPKHKVFNDVMKLFIKDKKLNISFSKMVNIFNSKGIKYADRRIEGTEIKKRAFIGIIMKEQNDIDDYNYNNNNNNNSDFIEN
jgi:hypothetical protein